MKIVISDNHDFAGRRSFLKNRASLLGGISVAGLINLPSEDIINETTSGVNRRLNIEVNLLNIAKGPAGNNRVYKEECQFKVKVKSKK
jgi:hypothetical protein